MPKTQAKTVWSISTIVLIGMLIAMEIVCERLISIPVGDVNRISLGKCVVILAGLWLGPIGGALVGALSDILGALIQGNGISPIITLSSMMWGIIPALTKPVLRKSKNTMKTDILVVAIIINSVVSTLFLTTWGLITYFGYTLEAILPNRMIQFAALTPMYCVICVILYLSPLTRMAANLTEK